MDGVCSHCRYVPPLSVCGLFCHMAVLGSLLVCLPESSAHGENKGWKDFTELIKLGPLSLSQS